MDFLANENIPLASIRLLRKSGHNVKSIGEETPGAKDRAVLDRAHAENLIILTFDRDYGELIYHHQSSVPAGVIYFRFEPSSPEEPAEILMNILQQGDVPFLNKFTVVERDKLRQRTFSRKK